MLMRGRRWGCGVQVFLGAIPSGLLYVQAGQINFKVPQEAAMDGTAPLRVVYQGRGSAAVEMRLGLEPATLSLERPARVGGPRWVHVQAPSFPWYGGVRYPVEIAPADFGCNEMEVRRNGALLPRIPMQAAAYMRVGLMCGNMGIPGHEMQHKDRLPLHLQYRFDQPGVYEVRYTRRVGQPEPVFQTAWTRIEIGPAQPTAPAPPPRDPDRKSTRLNSSHLGISYAVFCL